MRLWDRVKIILIFFQLLKNPTRTDLIFKGIDISSKDKNQKAFKAVESLVLSNSDFRRMHQENYQAEMPRLEKLALLPPESFGYHVYRHMHDNNLGFEIFPILQADNPIIYLNNRIYQDHDLWHVLLGYGIEIEDELAVQAFGVAQFNSPVGTLIVAGGLIHLLAKNPMRAVTAFHKLNEGFNIGKKAKFLLGVRLHDFFHLPIQELRNACQLQVQAKALFERT